MVDQCATCFFYRASVQDGVTMECRFRAPVPGAQLVTSPQPPPDYYCGDFSEFGPIENVFPLGFYGAALSGDYQILNRPRAVYEFSQSVNLKTVKLPVANAPGSQAVGTTILVHCQAGSSFGFYIGFAGGGTDAFMGIGMWAECTLVDNATSDGVWRIRYFPSFAPLGFVSSGLFLKTSDANANVQGF